MVRSLSTPQRRAALLVAEDRQSDQAIADAVGVTERTLENWKRRPDFAAAVEAHKARWAAELEQEGIANRQNRINALDERWHLMQRVIAERAADPSMRAPGSATGLLVRTYKPGKVKMVEEYKVDAGLLAELRAHELQAARELGQLVDKRDVTSGGKPLDLASLVLAAREAAANEAAE